MIYNVIIFPGNFVPNLLPSGGRESNAFTNQNTIKLCTNISTIHLL